MQLPYVFPVIRMYSGISVCIRVYPYVFGYIRMYSGISVCIRVYPCVLGYLNDLLLEMTDRDSLFSLFTYRFVQTTAMRSV